MTLLATRTVNVIPWIPGGRNPLGQTTDTYGTPVPQAVYGWGPAGTSFEVSTWRHVVTADLQVYAPPGFTCSPRDRCEVDGVTYEVQGIVEDYGTGPFGFDPGVVVNLKLIEAAT